MFLNGKGRVISFGYFNTKKNNKRMSVISIQANGDVYKIFGSAKIPELKFGDIVNFTVIAQKQSDSNYTFYLAKAEKLDLEN